MKLNFNSESIGLEEPIKLVEPLKLDEAQDQKSVFWKVRVWKSILRKSRKILSASIAAVFLAQLSLTGTVWAELPPPTAAELTNPQVPTVSVDTTTTSTDTSLATVDTMASTDTDTFLMEGPLSPATSTTSTTDSTVVGTQMTTLAASTTATGRSLYVSTTGNNANDGSTANPYATIAYAVSQLQAGDTLYINEGTYYQSAGGAVFTTSGTADAPITIQGLGNVIIEGTGTTTIGGYPVASNYNPAFDTGGQDYINFKNLTVNNLRAPVKVSTNSSYVDIDGVNADRNHFGIWVDGSNHVSVRNMTITNSRNGVRTDSTAGVIPTDILFENIDVSGSKDVYSGFETKYRNGDGFILEFGDRITIRNVKSHDNWDAGFDIKATNVYLEAVDAYANYHQAVKIWGSGIVFKDSLLRDTRGLSSDPVASEGFGVNNRGGSVTFINSVFSNNVAGDIRTDNQIGNPTTILENCIIARNISGKLWEDTYGGITDRNNIWYNAVTGSAGFTLNSTSRFIDPKFVDWNGKDFHLQEDSPAIDFGSTSYPLGPSDFEGNTRVVGSTVDAGAYEYQGLAIPDTTAPVISVVTSSNVAANGATINWTTNEASDSQVEYRVQGSTAWLATNVDTSRVTSHAVVLSGLAASTAYEYRVKSKDQAGNLATQAAISTFTTATPDTTVPVISAVVSSNITATGATINWTTNEASDSQVEYRVEGSTAWLATSVNATPVTNHSVVLSGLSPTTVYQYRVKSKDQAGNLATQATISNLTTTTPVTGNFVGVTEGATVSGVVSIGPNLTLYPSIRKVFYYLNGTQSGKVYASPYLWGGSTGDGTVGFDTKTLADGTYTLSMGYTDSTGDHNAAVSFNVVNATLPPADTTVPVISAVASASVTSTGATINWTTNEASDSQVQYRAQGTTTWLNTALNASLETNHSVVLSGLNPSTVYEYQVKSKDQAGNLATQATISNLTTLTPADTAAPVISAVASASVTSTGATINWTTNEASDSQVQYRAQGTTTWLNTVLNASLETNHSVVLSELNAGTVYEYQVKSKDQAGNLATQATISNLTTLTPADTTVPVISAVASASVTSTGATINWTTNEASDSQVQYRAQGTTTWLNTVLNASLVTDHSVVLSELNAGTVYEYQVKSKDQAGNLATQATISSLTTSTPTTACTTAMCGLTSGQVVSGTVKIQPNLTLNPDVKKVAYYLNGTQSGKEYTSPFTWGGVSGYDTTKLANGTYTLSGAITTSTGDKGFSITFTVNNSGMPPADTVAPVISAVTAVNITSSGALISWTTNEASDSQVEYRVQGTTTWSTVTITDPLATNHSVVISELEANTVYEYRVKSTDQAGNLATQSTISSLTTLSVTPPATVDFVGVTSGATVSGVVTIGPNLTLHPDVRKVAYYLNETQSGKYYSALFTWGGTTGFDTRTLENGTYTLTMIYTDSTGDHVVAVSFTVQN